MTVLSAYLIWLSASALVLSRRPSQSDSFQHRSRIVIWACAPLWLLGWWLAVPLHTPLVSAVVLFSCWLLSGLLVAVLLSYWPKLHTLGQSLLLLGVLSVGGVGNTAGSLLHLGNGGL